ncbi:uncharacterized protein LOC122502589 [Leptopilina heterotoma]|uniref:uncharacterized protein LOC122502589 n=1 Tax=Leptopilina heterotoma TaxID=63436 RepID=UPI001CA7DCF6|nr:uncharacterized protein LOC122502589 [Leptopilina heterotoma]
MKFSLCFCIIMVLKLTATAKQVTSFVQGAEKFSANLTASYSKQRPDGNFLVSPAGNVMSMTYLQSFSSSPAIFQIMEAFGLTLDSLKRSKFKLFTDNLVGDKDVSISVSTGLFISPDVRIYRRFACVSKIFFKAHIENVNFTYPSASKIINSWIENDNDYRFKGDLKFDIDNAISLFLANVVYFRGNWLNKFPIGNTINEKFTTSKKEYNVPMMYRTGSFYTGSIPGVKASFIELPYENKKFSMIIILPDEINGLEEVEDKLSTLNIQKLTENGESKHVKLSIPKFKIRKLTEMSSTLKSMGISEIFDYRQNFVRISKHDCNVSRYYDMSFIEVYEDGTESSSYDVEESDYEGDDDDGINSSNVASFAVNHPFHFKIIKNINDYDNVILFAGSVREFSAKMKPSLCFCLLLILKLTVAAENFHPFTKAAENFSARLTRIISKNETENVVTCPVGEVIALSLLGSSSYLTALTEIKDAMGITPEVNTREEFQFFIDNLHVNTSVTLKILTGLFINSKVPIISEFKNLSMDFFKIKVDSIDYSDAYGAAIKINSWLEEETDFEIDNILDFEKVNESTSMIVTNVVNFRGNWLNGFDTDSTVINTFSTSDGDKQNVPMMYTNNSFITGSVSDLNASFIELPYEDTLFSMIIILPNEVNGLEEVEDKLATMTIKELRQNGKNETVRLSMPRFEIETELEMTSALNKMGVNAIFTDSDYFDRISKNATHVSQFLQKSCINVNEQGTVASGVVGFQSASLVVDGTNYSEVPTFVVDRPFHYKIIKNVNDDSGESIVLFAGNVKKIEENPFAIFE